MGQAVAFRMYEVFSGARNGLSLISSLQNYQEVTDQFDDECVPPDVGQRAKPKQTMLEPQATHIGLELLRLLASSGHSRGLEADCKVEVEWTWGEDLRASSRLESGRLHLAQPTALSKRL